MAKRSDFAQKLLDDLRVRKERMAAPAESSNRSNTRSIGMYISDLLKLVPVCSEMKKI